MSNTVRVAPEDLMVSASTVDAHADGMWLTHGTATSRIEGAQKGVPPAANVALSAAVAKWQADSTALLAASSTTVMRYVPARRSTNRQMGRTRRTSRRQAIR